MLAGRSFSADEALSGSGIIVNREAERRFWPSGSALGSEVKQGAGWATVIGVVDNTINGGLTQKASTSLSSIHHSTSGCTGRSRTRSSSACEQRSSHRDCWLPGQPLRGRSRDSNTRGDAYRTALANSIDGPRFNTALLAAFSVIALVLAAVGLAAVISHEITERTHESASASRSKPPLKTFFGSR